MGRYCAECEYYEPSDKYSNNQWAKGEGYSRCMDCVGYVCNECKRVFRNQNELNMHLQVHRPKTVSCPICGDTRFGSGANAVQHVESGFCRGCRGADNAREQIYKFASNQRTMGRFMANAPRLTNGGNWEDVSVPDFPYNCPDCSKQFRHLSQLLQHQDQKHNNSRLMLRY